MPSMQTHMHITYKKGTNTLTAVYIVMLTKLGSAWEHCTGSVILLVIHMGKFFSDGTFNTLIIGTNYKTSDFFSCCNPPSIQTICVVLYENHVYMADANFVDKKCAM